MKICMYIWCKELTGLVQLLTWNITYILCFQLQTFDMKYNDLQQEALMNQDKNRQGLQELSAKEEELVIVKVELNAAQEKYKAKLNEVSSCLAT